MVLQLVNVNFVAVLVAAIASIVLGFLWYGPLFGKKWASLMGWGKMNKATMAKMKKSAGKGYAVGFLTAIVMAYVLAHFVSYAGAVTAIEGAQAGFWAWLGFVATVTAGSVLWEGKPKNLYFLNNGYQLISLMVMGAILVTL